MASEPVRVAAWLAVIVAALVFIAAVNDLSNATQSPKPTDRKPAAAYVGNTKTHKFHAKTCQYAGCPNCTARFATREEAIASGYRPGGCCHP